MKTYKCFDCRHIFQAEGEKKEFVDPVYGPCLKWNAQCPLCGAEAVQHESKPGKQKSGGGAPCGKYDSCSCCGT